MCLPHSQQGGSPGLPPPPLGPRSHFWIGPAGRPAPYLCSYTRSSLIYFCKVQRCLPQEAFFKVSGVHCTLLGKQQNIVIIAQAMEFEFQVWLGQVTASH